MPKIKWSAFPNAGDLQAGDIIVGLRAGNNVQLNPVTPNDVQVSLFNYSLATGVNDAFVATLVPPVTSLTDGLLVTLNTGSLTNNTGTPTLQVDAMPAKTIVYNNLQLLPGDLEVNNTYVLVYNSTTQTFNLINPSISAANTDLVQYNEYNAAIDSGIADAYIANLTPPASSLTGFLSILCKITNANTGASTLTVNGNTAPIVTANNQPLVGGELIANQVALFLYDSTWASFILVNPSNNVTTLLPVVNHRLARFSGTSGRIEDSSATLANTGVLTLTADAVINTVNIGLGSGNISTNTRLGVNALAANTTGARNVAIGNLALQSSNAANSSDNVVIGNQAAPSATTIYSMTLLGSGAGLSYTTSNNSVAVGVNSLRTATTGGDRSVAIGVNALYTTNGAVNTAVGYRAGEAFTGSNGLFIGGNAGVLTTGGENTIIGVDAASVLTTGINNTLIGRQAGSGQTTGSSCTSIGYRAAQSSTTVSNITAVGTDALRLNTVANNTAVGSNAMDASTTGTGTAVGFNALGALTTGAGNTAVGTSSLSVATTASFCTAVGQSALAANTASDNTAFGHNALTAVTSGYYHTAIGRAASQTITTNLETTAVGYGALALNTASNNTAIGSQAMVACTLGTGVAVGKSALAALTTGTGNCAVGQSALALMTTATNNTALGETAGLNNTANGGTFIGWQAGYNNASGIQNVAVGAAAGGQFRTGSSNTAIGTQAMGNLGTSAVANCVYVGQSAGIACTGNNNTGLGYFAGNSGATGAVAVTTGTANTMVGYRACPNAADAVGTISIGADAVAEKATGATSGDNGPGIAIGSASTPVGFRGDGTIYAAAGASAGYWRVKINGAFYKIQLYADA